MTTPAQIQALLRFLSQDSKLPLVVAMAKAKELQKANLITPEEILKKDLRTLQSILGEEKVAKQVSNAARRVTSKKRPHEGDGSPTKRSKMSDLSSDASSASQLESALVLPLSTNVDEITSTILLTNRAPLVLAFAVVLLKYTMPEQPLSSRLSLAQAVVSANSRSKAVSLGIETGKSVEDEGWGQGQPTVKVLGREINVLKRWGYSWDEKAPPEKPTDDLSDKLETPKMENNEHISFKDSDTQPALWGLDPEAMRKSNSKAPKSRLISPILPIHRPEAARNYLLKSFTFQKPMDSATDTAKKKRSTSDLTSEKEKALALLLGAIDLLCQSWVSVLSQGEMDGRAWSWYVTVRPDIESGITGWGQKGSVHLSKILDLRRKG
ncbi:hypothetical protein PAAG_01856 [Paracoccidioides lutzii Pb01]|uniref:Impact N-terminal domain-containing protein n=1 Tax=Paracoccidioides lutzii (strain ATCC MYA-826 / Pb01) TaxID=502779 RepID=C1GTL1_PARBA|nr:hypothetical protein PAAG_01856 [Paracoccidioides lutzii Pb01]EEH39667.1 hypothetical protein PAAG_01856 [Paracoccidioides lutzii Pb01]